MPSPNEVVLEPAAREFATATSQPPYLYQLPVEEGRNALEELQSGEDLKLEAGLEEFSVDAGPTGTVRLRLVRPPGLPRPAPVILYLHGAGWVFGSPSTHDRLVRELAVGAQAAVVFPHYARSPEARYPVALEQCWSAATWIVRSGRGFGLDPDRMMVAGDSVGGNLAIALTLLAKQRGGVRLAGQLLFYPVTDASLTPARTGTSPRATTCGARACSGSGTSTRPTRRSAPRSLRHRCGRPWISWRACRQPWSSPPRPMCSGTRARPTPPSCGQRAAGHRDAVRRHHSRFRHAGRAAAHLRG